MLNKHENIGLVARTGAGKTIIARLVEFALRNLKHSDRTLFLAPTCYLVKRQHQTLFGKINGNSSDITSITGETTNSSQRIWNDTKYKTTRTFLENCSLHLCLHIALLKLSHSLLYH